MTPAGELSAILCGESRRKSEDITENACFFLIRTSFKHVQQLSGQISLSEKSENNPLSIRWKKSVNLSLGAAEVLDQF